MPRFHGYDAYVEVDGVPLTEYGGHLEIDAAGVPFVSCWVPSTAGKAFRVHCVDQRWPRTSDEYSFAVDGVPAQGTVLPDDYCGPPVSTLAAIDAPDGPRALVFTDLATTEDESALELRGSPRLGEIALHITPVRIVAYGPPLRRAVQLAPPVVHERSKKVGAHAVQLGAPVHVPETFTLHTQHVGLPFVIFVFRYRPLSLLQAQGIAPPPDSAHVSPSPDPKLVVPAPASEAADESGEDEEEIRRLEERLRQLRKRKRSAEVKVKEEPDARRPRLSSATGSPDLASD